MRAEPTAPRSPTLTLWARMTSTSATSLPAQRRVVSSGTATSVPHTALCQVSSRPALLPHRSTSSGTPQAKDLLSTSASTRTSLPTRRPTWTSSRCETHRRVRESVSRRLVWWPASTAAPRQRRPRTRSLSTPGCASRVSLSTTRPRASSRRSSSTSTAPALSRRSRRPD